MRLVPGKRYQLKYRYFHHDPAPYLFVTWADGKYVKGFNLHYLAHARFGRPVESFKRVDQKDFDKWLELSRKDGVFGRFFDMLELGSTKIDEETGEETRPNRRLARMTTKLIQRKAPWAMGAYRVYKADGIKVLR